MSRDIECRPLRKVLTVCTFICIPTLAAGSSIQHVANEYDGTSFQLPANVSMYFKRAPDDLPTLPANSTQYRLLPNANHMTKSTKPVSDVPKHEYTYKGENHSRSEGDDSNQRYFLFIDHKLYFPPILKKKRRRCKKSRKPGTREKEVTTKQDQSSNEKGTEQNNSCEQTPTGNDSQVHSPVMEESVQLSSSIYRGGNSKSDVMVTPSQNPKAQADKDDAESGSEEPDTRPWLYSVKAVNTCALDELVIPKLLTVVGTHVFNGSVLHENNVATEDTCMGSVIKPFVELGPPPEKELCNYCIHWYANAVPTA